MKKSFLLGVFVSFLAALGGCGKGDVEDPDNKGTEPSQQVLETDANICVDTAPEPRSSRDVVDEFLAAKGIRRGVDVDKGRMLTVSTRGFSLKGEDRDKDESCETNETYDFPDDEGDDFETRRFKTVWKAYADGLADIARMICETVKSDMGDIGGTKNIQSAAELRLDGVVTVTTAESLGAKGRKYEVTVAVCQSKKRQKLYKDNLTENHPSSPGRYSLKEWIDENSSTGIICPQSFVDNDGVWWRVAGVPVEVGSGRTSAEIASLTGKAMHYAFEAAIRTMWVDVSAFTSFSSISTSAGGSRGTREKILRKVSIRPISTVASPNDPFRVKWLELDKVDAFTGKPIRLVVCAIRDDAGAREAERAYLFERVKRGRQASYDRGRQDALREQFRKTSGRD